eukprot:jgi/Chrzof1/14664/Cz09g11090.t1
MEVYRLADGLSTSGSRSQTTSLAMAVSTVGFHDSTDQQGNPTSTHEHRSHADEDAAKQLPKDSTSMAENMNKPELGRAIEDKFKDVVPLKPNLQRIKQLTNFSKLLFFELTSVKVIHLTG